MKNTVLSLLAVWMCTAALGQTVPAGDTEHIRQDFLMPRIDLWTPGHIPGSKGLALKDSIYNNRTWRIMTPRIYVYQPGPEQRTSTAVLVIPGGGYAKQAFEGAGDQTARWLSGMGITAFMLIHRLPNSPDAENGSILPLQDAQRAIRYIRAHAAEYGISPNHIGVIGASSGGHVTACLSTVNDDLSRAGDALDEVSFKPDFAILISPVISMDDAITHRGSRSALLGAGANDPALRDFWSMEKQPVSQNPPMLFFHAADDTGVSPMNSLLMYKALTEAGVRGCSIHIFPNGQHSIGVRNQPGSTALWPEIADRWMQETGMLENH